MSQPVIAGAGEAVVPSGFQSLLLVASDPIHRLSQMLSDMEFVEDDLPIRSRHVLPYRGDVGVPHVHGHRFNALLLLFRQGFPEAVQAALLPSFGQVKRRLVCKRSTIERGDESSSD